MGSGGERLYEDMDEAFCKRKWGVRYEKKTGGLSGAAARTSELKKNKKTI